MNSNTLTSGAALRSGLVGIRPDRFYNSNPLTSGAVLRSCHVGIRPDRFYNSKPLAAAVSAEDGVVVGGGLVSVALALGSVGGGDFGEALVEGAGAVQNGAFEAGSEGRFDGTGGALGSLFARSRRMRYFVMSIASCFLVIWFRRPGLRSGPPLNTMRRGK